MGKLPLTLAACVLALSSTAWAQGVEIVIATYGAGRLHDVTSVVRNALASGRRELQVTLDALGVNDPAPGRVKSLRILYRAGDALYETSALDFETLALPTAAPAVAAATPPSTPTPAAPAPASNAQPTTGGFFDTTPPAKGTAEPATPTSAPTPAPTIVSPVASVPNGACLYVEANYKGTPYCFATGSATASLGNQRRRFRSLRLVGSGKAVVLFDADNFLGASVRLTASQPDLRASQGPFYVTDFEDRAASLRVE